MSYGRLYLLGDAAHVISPMGAKGMNLALRDAEVFATAIRDYASAGDDSGLRAYSDVCLARAWRYQEWSYWLSNMMFGLSGQARTRSACAMARARFEYAVGTDEGARSWAAFWTGLV